MRMSLSCAHDHCGCGAPATVGRHADRLREIARRHQVELWSTDLQGVLDDSSIDVYFDAQVTSQRPAALKSAIATGKHIFVEKPTAPRPWTRRWSWRRWPARP